MFNVKHKEKEEYRMQSHINFLVRAGILIVLILAFIFVRSTKDPAEIPPAYTEPPTSAPTETTEPPETEAPTETTTPETEPPAATEPPTEPETEPPTEPETEPTETAPPYEYTEKDLEYLALVIYQEAGGDMFSDETRLMVGTVVMNRVADDRYPDTIFDVILQRGQYGRLHWTGPMWPARRWEAVEAHAVERAYTIAERILNGERALPADVIYQSEYIQGEIVVHQGGFYFCR